MCPAQNLTTKVNLDVLHLCSSSRIATLSLVFCWFSPLILSHTKVDVIYIYTHIYKVKIVLHVSHYAAILRSGDRRGASNGSAQNFKNIDDGPIKVGSFEEIFFKTLGASPSLINRINMSRIE